MRIARYTPPGEVHHIISRFVDEQWFITTPEERSQYLRLLGKALAKTDWMCLAYAIMSSHIHLAMVAGSKPSESWSRRVNSPFATYFNELHERIGPLFAGRAEMWIYRTERVGHLLAYIHNNPVRAGVVTRAAHSNWTSHNAYIGAVAPSSWLSVERGLQLSGLEVEEFDSWVHEQRGLRRKDLDLAAIDREAKRLGRIVLGTPAIEPLEVPLLARPFSHVRPNPGRIVSVVQDVLGLEPAELLDRRRGGAGVIARAIALKVGRTFGVPLSSVASAMGISPAAASKLTERELAAEEEFAMRTVASRIRRELEDLMAAASPPMHAGGRRPL